MSRKKSQLSAFPQRHPCVWYRIDPSREHLATPGGWDTLRIVRYHHWFDVAGLQFHWAAPQKPSTGSGTRFNLYRDPSIKFTIDMPIATSARMPVRIFRTAVMSIFITTVIFGATSKAKWQKTDLCKRLEISVPTTSGSREKYCEGFLHGR